jgi:hypothetical protein
MVGCVLGWEDKEMERHCMVCTPDQSVDSLYFLFEKEFHLMEGELGNNRESSDQKPLLREAEYLALLFNGSDSFF